MYDPDATVPLRETHTPRIQSLASARECAPLLTVPVGTVFHGCVVTEADHELERHILECVRANEAAYARFKARDSYIDREEALQWDDERKRAMQRRRPEVIQALEQHALLRIDVAHSIGYFASDAASVVGRQG